MYGGMDVYDPDDQSLLRTLGIPVKDILIQNVRLSWLYIVVCTTLHSISEKARANRQSPQDCGPK